MTPGDKFAIEAKGWVHPDTYGPQGNVWFALHFWDAQGVYITGAGVRWDAADAGTGWQTRTNTVTVPANAARAAVRVRATGLAGGTILVDDMSVRRSKVGNHSGLVEIPCASFDYSPLQDPQFPALVAPLSAPSLTPEGWVVNPGAGFSRYWARIEPVRPSTLLVVPVIKIRATSQAVRGVRVALWPSSATTTERCDPLFSVVLNYVPTNVPIYIDGEREAVYSWDGTAPFARRAESLAFSPEMGPVQWTSLNSDEALLVTLDTFDNAGKPLRADLSLVPKSD